MFRGMLIAGVAILVAVFGYASHRAAKSEKPSQRFQPWYPSK
jgi:hypothetical protein